MRVCSYSPKVLASSTRIISCISSAGERCITLYTVLSNADCASLWKHIMILVLGIRDTGGYSRLRHLIKSKMVLKISHRANLQIVPCIWDISKVSQSITSILVECMPSKASFLLPSIFVTAGPASLHPKIHAHHCNWLLIDE